ncbi:hypothetical protein PG994_002345 [Apiospora phragmitis]|uniref:Uncharacterized protein n=1 Tax=Apiospora phragmitis TaxID=2905665 RepID=A0ABR1WW28_9PEZI
MADPFSITTGVAGLIGLGMQIASGVAKLRDACKLSEGIPDVVKSLAVDIDFIQRYIDRLALPKSINVLDVTYCNSRLQAVAEAFDRLPQPKNDDSKTSKVKTSVAKLGRMRYCKDDLDSIKALVNDAKLSLVMLAVSPEVRYDVSLVPPASSQGLLPEGESSDHDHNSQQTCVLGTRVIPLKSRKFKETYSISYYRQRRRPSRFWSFEYTPLSMVLEDCDFPNCNGRHYSVSLRVALSQLGLPWALALGFNFAKWATSYSMYPVLTPQATVRFTSPGFRLLFEISHGEVELAEGIRKFTEMYDQDRSMKHHVNPAGRGYIEARRIEFDNVTALLDLFIDKFEIKQGWNDIAILYSSAHWIGEAPHMAIFGELLNHGFDSSEMGSPEPKKWPKPCDPNWISEELTQDPFFTKLLSMLLVSDPEFGGTSPLGYDVLHQPDKAKKRLSNGPVDFTNQRNFLGQTPLHLAAAEQEGLVLPLLEAGHSVDARDIYGITPLMYTAALGNTGAAKILISDGADMFAVDELRERDFLRFALARCRYRYALDIAHHVQKVIYPESTKAAGSYFAKSILLMGLVQDNSREDCDPSYIEELMNLVDDVNFKFRDSDQDEEDNHLLHYLWTVDQAKAIEIHGFTDINYKNSKGVTALMKIAYSGRHHVVRYYLTLGADINAEDCNGWSALSHALQGWVFRREILRDLDEMDYIGTISLVARLSRY